MVTRQQLDSEKSAAPDPGARPDDLKRAPTTFLSLIVLIPALLGLGSGQLAAQNRGSLQAAAQVLPVEPSRTAVGLALQAASTDPQSSRTLGSTLAVITVRSSVAASQADPAHKSREVRIDFLRN